MIYKALISNVTFRTDYVIIEIDNVAFVIYYATLYIHILPII